MAWREAVAQEGSPGFPVRARVCTAGGSYGLGVGGGFGGRGRLVAVLTEAEREVVLNDPLTRRLLDELFEDGDKIEAFLEGRARSLLLRSERPPTRTREKPVTGRELLPPVKRR